MEKLTNVNVVTLNFNLREPKGNKCTNVYAVLKTDGKQYKFAIGCKVNSYQWDKKRQVPTIANNMIAEDRENNIRVFEIINQIKFGYYRNYSDICSTQNVSANDVIAQIKSIINETISNTEMANDENLRKSVVRTPKATTLLKKAMYIYYSEVATQATESTKETAKIQLSSYIKYTEEIGKDKISMLSQKGLNDYKSYLLQRSKELKESGKSIYDSNRHINNKCGLVARLINRVMAEHSDFLKYKIQKVEYTKLREVVAKNEDKKRRPLTDEEINKLSACTTLNAKEKEYRDLFILECNGSFRVSDTWRLFDNSQHEVYKKGDYDLMVIDTQKEHITSVIWLNETIKNILAKYENGFKYADPKEKGFAQKYNRYLKKIAQKAGLESRETYIDAHGENKNNYLYEIIGSHFARYTFIYNGLFVLGFTPNELKDFTGHADDKMIQEVYAVFSTNDKVTAATKALDRVLLKRNINDSRKDKVSEYKDVLAFYGCPYSVYRYIDDAEELLSIIIERYEIPLKEQFDRKVLKAIYNSKSDEDREQYEKLLATIKEIESK